MRYIYYIAAILIFTIFDIVGYYFILTKKETIEPKKKHLIIYRTLQIAFQIAIIICLWLIDFSLAFCFEMSHWFGLCDLLYYLLRGVVIKSDDMFWLWWTPFGFAVNYVGQYKIRSGWLWLFSALAIAISIFILSF